MIQHFADPAAASPHYSPAVRIGDLIITSGQLGADPGGPDVPFADQARLALQRLVAAVELAGGSRETIAGVRAYLKSMDDYPEWNRVYGEVMHGDGPMPARTTVSVGDFLQPLLVEVEALAAVRDDG